MSDTSCARKRARSSIFIVCESLFPIRPHSKCTLLSRRRRSSTKSVDNKYNPFPVPRFYCSTRCPRQGCCCRVCQVCRRTTLHLHQHGPRDHVYSQHAHPIYDLKDVKHLSHGLRKLVTFKSHCCQLFGFTDASWTDDKCLRHSTLCYVLFCNRAAFSWK